MLLTVGWSYVVNDVTHSTLLDRVSQKKLIFLMLTADALNVCEIMLNIHCKKIRSFGGRVPTEIFLNIVPTALVTRPPCVACSINIH